MIRDQMRPINLGLIDSTTKKHSKNRQNPKKN